MSWRLTAAESCCPDADEGTTFLVQHRDQLPASLRTFESTDGAHLPLMDKFDLYRTAAMAGVRVPWMRHVTTQAGLAEIRDDVTFPCVLKPGAGPPGEGRVGIRDAAALPRASSSWSGAGSCSTSASTACSPSWSQGPETALEGAVTIRRRDGSYPLEYSRRKLRQWPPDYGVASLMEATHSPEMLTLNRRLLDHAGFHGVSSCEAKRHSGTGQLYLIEINVRVPASFGLAQACGADGAWRLYATLAGLPLGAQPQPIPGRKVLMHPDLLAALYRIRSRDASVGRVLSSFRGTRDFGVFALRDPQTGTRPRRSVRREDDEAAPIAVDVSAHPVDPPTAGSTRSGGREAAICSRSAPAAAAV